MTYRIAKVNGMTDLARVNAYLPDNYGAVEVMDSILIVGYDSAGWTLDGYVVPRLASGLIWAEEVTPIPTTVGGLR